MRILIWQKGNDGRIGKNFFLALCDVCDWECIDRANQNDVEYSSQSAFDHMVNEFEPDAIAICDTFRNALPIRVPDELFVFSYWDHVTYQFAIIGKQYFERIHERDYVLLSYLDMENVDFYKILNDAEIRKHFIQFCFVPLPYENDKYEKYDDVTSCDVSLVKYYQEPMRYFTNFLRIRNGRPYEIVIQRCIGHILVCFMNEINEKGGKIADVSWMDDVLIDAFNRFDIWKYTDNKRELFNRWRNFAIVNLFESSYTSCVFDWLTSSGVDLQLWGSGWELVPKYAPYAKGEVRERSRKLQLINRNCKIIVNHDAQISLHRRIFEAIQEKTLVIQMQVDFSWDWSSYVHFFKENESIVVARSKTELIEKIHYFLTHEEERKRIASNAYDTLKNNNLFCEDVLRTVGERMQSILK